MCGLFGFVGSRPDLTVLSEVALAASVRGPHGWGVAWANGKPLQVERHMGPMALPVDQLARTAGLVAGHARMVTSGRQDRLDDYQPVVSTGLALAHNGTCPEAIELASLQGLAPVTGVDSAALLALIEAGHAPAWPDRVERALALVAPVGPTALLLLVPGAGVLTLRRRSIAGRPGHPLFWHHGPGGLYLSSRSLGPGWVEHPDDTTMWWRP